MIELTADRLGTICLGVSVFPFLLSDTPLGYTGGQHDKYNVEWIYSRQVANLH